MRAPISARGTGQKQIDRVAPRIELGSHDEVGEEESEEEREGACHEKLLREGRLIEPVVRRDGHPFVEQPRVFQIRRDPVHDRERGRGIRGHGDGQVARVLAIVSAQGDRGLVQDKCPELPHLDRRLQQREKMGRFTRDWTPDRFVGSACTWMG